MYAFFLERNFTASDVVDRLLSGLRHLFRLLYAGSKACVSHCRYVSYCRNFIIPDENFWL